ncbi:MAG: prenyltransferase [Nitrospirota bacterium]|nr:prenyltransferase [Nitrospirota bacterium]
MMAKVISLNKSYILGTRLPFVSASVLPAVLGSVWCWVYESNFYLFNALLGVMGVFFLHLGANTLNDYFDWDESDKINKFPTPFSGGSRSRLKNVLTKNAFLYMALLFFLIALSLGGVLVMMDRPLVLLIGAIGGLCGILYSLQPFSFQSRGIGELIIFFAFGPLITLGTGYAISGVFKPEFFLIGIPNGFVVANILWINEFPDYEADKNAGKRNLVVRLGTAHARYGYIALQSFFYIAVILLIIFKLYPVWSLLILLSAPLAIKTSMHMWRNHSNPLTIVPAQAGTIQFQMLSAVVITASLIAEKFI